MTKQDHTVYIYKTDRRTKTGERLFSTTVWAGRDAAGMEREVRELLMSGLYPVSEFRIEYFPTMKTVKNLMTGVEVQIARPVWAEIAYDDDAGTRKTERLEGFLARCALHEIDQMSPNK